MNSAERVLIFDSIWGMLTSLYLQTSVIRFLGGLHRLIEQLTTDQHPANFAGARADLI